ncbi:hypothetical protein BD626DRAFT_542875 [Schizophyllum amplum]|uniref:Uncharacterized protein n=1 Tax=Schizophyllum amplum TaxID=97359 RepID=A0A550BS51_9AGAR|nr:hypothetical protein BD626DRAFT_542875 [Auriculariopsis ampla]
MSCSMPLWWLFQPLPLMAAASRHRVAAKRVVYEKEILANEEGNWNLQLHPHLFWLAHIFNSEYLVHSPFRQHFLMLLGNKNAVPPHVDDPDLQCFRDFHQSTLCTTTESQNMVLGTAGNTCNKDEARILGHMSRIVSALKLLYKEQAYEKAPLSVKQLASIGSTCDAIFSFMISRAVLTLQLFSPAITGTTLGTNHPIPLGNIPNLSSTMQACGNLHLKHVSRVVTFVLGVADQVYQDTLGGLTGIPLGNPYGPWYATRSFWIGPLKVYYATVLQRLQEDLQHSAKDLDLDQEQIDLLLCKVRFLQYWALNGHTVESHLLQSLFYGPLPSPAVIAAVLDQCCSIITVTKLLFAILLSYRDKMPATLEEEMSNILSISAIQKWWDNNKLRTDAAQLHQVLAHLLDTCLKKQVMRADLNVRALSTWTLCVDPKHCLEQTTSDLLVHHMHPEQLPPHLQASKGVLHLASLLLTSPWPSLLEGNTAQSACNILHNMAITLPWLASKASLDPSLAEMQGAINKWYNNMLSKDPEMPLYYMHPCLRELEMMQGLALPDYIADIPCSCPPTPIGVQEHALRVMEDEEKMASHRRGQDFQHQADSLRKRLFQQRQDCLEGTTMQELVHNQQLLYKSTIDAIWKDLEMRKGDLTIAEMVYYENLDLPE